jgi:O-antigen ligase
LLLVLSIGFSATIGPTIPDIVLTAIASLVALGLGIVALVDLRYFVVTMLTVVVFFGEGFNPDQTDRIVFYRFGVGHVYLIEIVVWLAILLMLLRRRRFPGSINRGIVAFGLALCGSMLLSGFYGMSRGANLQDAFGFYEWRAWCMGIVLGLSLTLVFDVEDVRFALRWLTIATAIHAAQGLLGLSLGLGEMHPTYQVRVPFFDSAEGALFSLFALYAFMLGTRADGSGKRLLWMLASLLMIVALVLDRRRSYWLAFSLMGAVVLALRWWHLRTIILMAPVLFALVDVVLWTPWASDRYTEVTQMLSGTVFVDASASTRFHLLDLQDVGITIRDNLLLGVGSGSGFTRFLTLQYHVGAENIGTGLAHSAYLTVWLRMGLVGLLLFVGLLMTIIRAGVIGIGRPRPLSDLHVLVAGIVGYSSTYIWTTELFPSSRVPLIFGVVLAAIARFSAAEVQAQRQTSENPTSAISPARASVSATRTHHSR